MAGPIRTDEQLNSFWLSAARSPHRPALIAADGRQISAGQLFAGCNRLANGLRARGMDRSDTVVLALPNGPEFFEAYLAAMQVGWYITPLNTHLTANEMAHVLRDSKASVLIARPKAGSFCAPINSHIPNPAQRMCSSAITGIASVPGSSR